MKKLLFFCLLFIVKTSFCQLKTLTRVNVRDLPSLSNSKIMNTLEGGMALPDAVLEDGWYKVFIDSVAGYIKSDYVADHYFEKPILSKLIKECSVSYILAINPQDSCLATIYDYGWGGAVDGPFLMIIISYYSRHKKKSKLLGISPDYFPGSGEMIDWQQKHINYA